MAPHGRSFHLIMVEKAWRSSQPWVDEGAEKRDGAVAFMPAFLLLLHPRTPNLWDGAIHTKVALLPCS